MGSSGCGRLLCVAIFSPSIRVAEKRGTHSPTHTGSAHASSQIEILHAKGLADDVIWDLIHTKLDSLGQVRSRGLAGLREDGRYTLAGGQATGRVVRQCEVSAACAPVSHTIPCAC